MSRNILSKVMNLHVDEILSGVVDGTLDVECTLFSSENPNYSFTCRIVDELDIIQDFVNAYSDYITVMTKLAPQEMLDVLDNAQGLRCRIIFKQSSVNLQEKAKTVFEINRKVVIKDQGDLFKRYALGSLIPTKDNPVQEHHFSNLFDFEFDLYEDEFYLAKKAKFNFIARDVVMEDVLLLISNIFGFKRVNIYPPDNVKKYTNFIIPPMATLADFATYLQSESRFGIYNEGVGCYVTGGVLYIYPIYNNKLDTKNTINIYSVAQGMFTGNKAYHIVINGDYHILCNSGADDKNLLFQGAENLGNSFLIPDTDKVIDLFKSQGEGEFTINKDTFNTVTLNNTEGVVKNTYTPMYVESDNLFSRRSFLASINRTMVAIDWDHAIPMSIKPGQAVKYCYDTDGKYSAKGGVCHRVSYHVRPTDGVGKKLYTCKAKLTLSTES